MREKSQYERDIEALMASMDVRGREEVNLECYEFMCRWVPELRGEVERRGEFRNGALVRTRYYASVWVAAIVCCAGKNPSCVWALREVVMEAAANAPLRTKIAAVYRLAGFQAVADIVRGLRDGTGET